MGPGDTLRLTAEIRLEVAAAADQLLTLTERGLADIAGWRAGDAAALDRIEAGLCCVLEACAFGDLVGQRLEQLEALLATGGPTAGDPLLNGPARSGAGLDQAAADQVLTTDPPAPTAGA